MGSKPKAPPPPPDPRIAEEDARKLAVAMAHKDAQDMARRGVQSTVLNKGVAGTRSALTARPTDPMVQERVVGTEYQNKLSEISSVRKSADDLKVVADYSAGEGRAQGPSRLDIKRQKQEIQATADSMQGDLAASKVQYDNITKGNALSYYMSRQRFLTGVTGTKAADNKRKGSRIK